MERRMSKAERTPSHDITETSASHRSHPIDKPRELTKILKLKQRRLIEEWCKKQRKDNTE